MSNPIKMGVDVSAISVSFLALLELAPKIAALLSAIWLAIQIVEFVKNKIKGRRERKNK